MANVKISELPNATSLSNGDSFPVVQGGVTKQAARSVLFASPTFTGTTTAAILTATGDVTFDGGAFVFNESGADKDARFEGDTDTNLLFLDASTDRVGIGTSTPAAKLDVDGGAAINGNVTLTGNLGLGAATAPAYLIDAAAPAFGDSTIRLTKSGSVNTTINAVTGALTFGIDGAGGTTERMRLDSSGNVGIGTILPGAKLQVNGGASPARGIAAILSASVTGAQLQFTQGGVDDWAIGQPAGTSAFAFWAGRATGSDGAERMRLDSSGNLFCQGVYDNTTGSAANVFVASNGLLQRSTSSLKYKTDIQDAAHGLADVMRLRPVTYKSKTDGERVFGGLIAEEVHSAGLTEFVQYASDGSPDALAYGNMVSLLTKAIQEQQAVINELRARVAALEAG